MKRDRVFLGIIIGLIVIIGYLGNALLASINNPQPKVQNEIMNPNNSDYSDLKISSIKIHNLANGTLADITSIPNATIKRAEPILLHANFTNSNHNAEEYVTLIKVDEKNGTDEPVISMMTGKIGGENGTIAIETLWQPTKVGEYTMTILAQKKSDMNRTPVFGIGTRADVAITVV